MVILVSLDFVLTVLAVLLFLGIGWATMLASWLWSHAIAVGIVLLIFHIILSIFYIIATGSDYKLVGAICALIHAIFPPAIVISAYQMTVMTGENFSGNLFLQWLLVFGCMSVVEWLWSKAIDTRGGGSYVRLILFTLLSMAAAVIVIGLIRSEGF